MILHWARLRLAYNAVLAVTTVVFVVGLRDELVLPSPLGIAGRVLVGAVLANICFTIGPVAVACANLLGIRSRMLTPVVFALGTLVSIPLVLLFVLGAFGWTIG